MSTEEQLQREWRDSIRAQLSKIDADVEVIKASVAEIKGANVVNKLGTLEDRVHLLELHRAKAIGIIVAGVFVFNVLFAWALKLIAS
jgi:hypothetical protein